MADWVATVALGKLSDAEGKNKSSNVLWAVWAPLLLLHLGGPDTITAYSLEDNQLWMRHVMGLVVQLSVAIYVILMSWKNSWFSFMSIPALVVGIIKYGERTLGSEVGLIFQIVLLKTREEDEGNWHEIDIAITGVLIVGALALEIYAAVVIFSSNWMMIWVIKQGREEWVKWLSQRFPWLFNKKENWSQIMGQFDLLGYCLKCGNGEFDRSRSTRIIRSVLGYNYKYEDKWNRYLHKTEYSVHPLVCNAILELCNPRIDPLISDSLIREVDEIWETLHYLYTGGTFSKGIRCVHLATEICYHLEMEWDGGSGEDNPSGSNSSLWKQNKKVSKALSNYMMCCIYL
ncbi:hypothetical protein RHMOL_Rhmol13G0258700 [Rhododendron molle]|uniref:Uncharacterized protein n=1 Tax=Rhododendron molle TaxID=49168 RepID=A0ACC0LCC8_RHOML|nr:hypothetical protein RHMOL_Rhmol13G0258700 [Rhododendron molle]